MKETREIEIELYPYSGSRKDGVDTLTMLSPATPPEGIGAVIEGCNNLSVLCFAYYPKCNYWAWHTLETDIKEKIGNAMVENECTIGEWYWCDAYYVDQEEGERNDE